MFSGSSVANLFKIRHRKTIGQIEVEPLYSDYSLKELAMHLQRDHSNSYEELMNVYRTKILIKQEPEEDDN